MNELEREDFEEKETIVAEQIDIVELLEVITDRNQELYVENFDTYSELLFSIEEKLGSILEQAEIEQELLFEENDLEQIEAVDYTDLITSLDTNLTQLSLLYESELLRQAEEPEPEEIPATDYSDSILSIDQKLEAIFDIKDSMEAASSAVVTYSVFYIPLAVIIISLYWFFSQFMNRHY